MKRFKPLFLLILLTAFVAMGSGKSSLQDFFQREGNSWRIHWSEGSVARAIYGKSRSSAGEEGAVRKFLRANASLFGIKDPAALRLEHKQTTKSGTHFVYRQFHGQFPVVGGQIRVSVNSENRITAVNGKYQTVRNIASSRIASSSEAFRTALQFSRGEAYDAGLFVYPGFERSYLVRRIEVEPSDAGARGARPNPSAGSWLLHVDAADPCIVRYASGTHASLLEGEGTVWRENPITTPQRAIETLINMDTSQTLSGKFVRLYNANFQDDVVFPIRLSDYTRAKESNRKFHYPDQDARATEVMTYHHANLVHDRWHSFGFKALDARAPFFVNTSSTDGGPGYDNAYYSRSNKFRRTGIYVLGGGDQYNNSGLDAEVIYHEYGHGVLDKIEPGMLEPVESNYPWAVHESFGDISAAAITRTPKLFDFAFRLKSTGKWLGRNMNNRKRFPADVIWKQIGISEPHHTALILDGAWWDLQKKIGPIPAQQLIYEAVHQVPAEVDFFQIRDAILTADENLNAGRNSQNILNAFARHGLTGPNPGQKGALSVNRVVTAAYTPATDYQITTQISRGQSVSIVVEYVASNLTPGYNLVADDLEFIRPGGSNAFVVTNIGEVTNGTHTEIHDALHILEIPTDQNTTVGSYTVRFKPRLGGTNNALAEQSVTFTVQ